MTLPVLDPSAEASRVEIGAQAESALRAIRSVLAIMSAVLVAALRPESSDSSVPRIALTLWAIATVAIVLNAFSTRVDRHIVGKTISQIADTLAVVGLVVVLDDPLAHQAWVLMIIPMVSATVRFGAVATLLTWILSSALFLSAALAGIVGGFEDRTLLIRIPGLLLAVAITVSLLARWMREGWEIQNSLTESIAVRERRLATIENTARALHRLDQREALAVCATSVLDLGFDASTITYEGAVEFAVGSTDVVSAGVAAIAPTKPVVTAWLRDKDERVFSVVIPEPESGRNVVAWSTTPPTEDQAQALGTLVAHTSTAIETAAILEGLQQASLRDELTGLLNRRGVDDALGGSNHVGIMAVAFIDLDDLKAVNDSYGHAAGDRAICAVAGRLEDAAGSEALAARFGGDEFVIIVPGGTLDDVSGIAKTVLEAAGQPVSLGPLKLRLSVSIGAAADDSPVPLGTLLTRADKAVYQAKSLGKGTLVVAEASGGFRTVV